jgi:hypothetical protein
LKRQVEVRIEQSPPGDVDSFTDAVFEAEGMGDMSYTDLRRQVIDVVDHHPGTARRWTAPGGR